MNKLSRAPFLGSIVFLGLGFWTVQSDGAEGAGLRLASAAIYGILGVALACHGAYLHQKGKETIGLPNRRTIVLFVASLTAVSAVGFGAAILNAANLRIQEAEQGGSYEPAP